MVNFKEAYDIAKSVKESIDYCVEDENAFIFGLNEERFSIGGNSPVVVIKATGKPITMSGYVLDYPHAEAIREIDLIQEENE